MYSFFTCTENYRYNFYLKAENVPTIPGNAAGDCNKNCNYLIQFMKRYKFTAAF